MIKALASDFDGTLYFMGQKDCFKEADLHAIHSLQQAGNLFGICSGRSLKGILDPVGDKLKLDFYILTSGALILDSDLHILYEQMISRKIVKELFDRYQDRVEAIIQANDTVYTFVGHYPHQVIIQSLDDIKGNHIYGVSFGADSIKEAKEICDEINQIYGDEVRAFVNITNIDIVSKYCSKGNAIKKLKELLKIDYIGGIGDSYNDIPMLKEVDEAFTFVNAPKSVKQVAHHLVTSVEEATYELLK